jgi:hypothetical protein
MNCYVQYLHFTNQTDKKAPKHGLSFVVCPATWLISCIPSCPMLPMCEYGTDTGYKIFRKTKIRIRLYTFFKYNYINEIIEL